MPIRKLLPNAQHFAEFYGNFHGTCGETALATALVCATPHIESKQDAILDVLRARFNEPPADVVKHLRKVAKEKRLNDLVRYAAICPDLQAFLDRLLNPKPTGK